MCLGIPGKVVDINDSGPLRMGRVDFGGVRKEACLAYLPEVGLGDYVIVHVGFAITQVDEDEALRTIEMLRAIDAEGVAQELGAMADPLPGGSFEPEAARAGAAPPSAGPLHAAERGS